MDTLNTSSPTLPAAQLIPTRTHRPWLLPVGVAVLVAVGMSAGVLIGRHNAVPAASASGLDGVAAGSEAAAIRPPQAMPHPADVAKAATTPTKPVPHPQAKAETRHSGAESRTPLDTQPTRVVQVCASCGVVESVQAQTRQGEGTGVGAVAGGVVGGLLGNQVGKGNGRTAMTVIGAIGGGMAGNAIEKNQRASTVYVVKVRMDDSTLRSFTRSEPWSVGQRVTVDGSSLQMSSQSAPATPRDELLKTRNLT